MNSYTLVCKADHRLFIIFTKTSPHMKPRNCLFSVMLKRAVCMTAFCKHCHCWNNFASQNWIIYYLFWTKYKEDTSTSVFILMRFQFQSYIMQFSCIYINTEEGRGVCRNMSIKWKFKLKCAVSFIISIMYSNI